MIWVDVFDLQLALVLGHMCLYEVVYLVTNIPASCVAHLLGVCVKVERDIMQVASKELKCVKFNKMKSLF